jgi:hypothetical protein
MNRARSCQVRFLPSTTSVKESLRFLPGRRRGRRGELANLRRRFQVPPSAGSRRARLGLVSERSLVPASVDGTGALVGTAVGAGSGMLSGATQGQAKADQQATEQLEGVALQEEDVRRNFTVSGYVFFPKGTYRELEMVLVNHETGGTESIREPWH